jgi:hypothetical protein
VKTFKKFREQELTEAAGKPCPKCGSKKHDGWIPPDFESVHCNNCGKCYEPGNGPQPYSEQVITERFFTRAEALQAYYDGVREGSIGKCPNCGSPNLSGCNRCPTAPDFDVRTCVDCGTASKDWRIKLPEDEGGAPPTNNAGQGNIAGIGVGPQGEPGVSPVYQRKRGMLKLMNGPAVDPRMFADKIFKHGSEK